MKQLKKALLCLVFLMVIGCTLSACGDSFDYCWEFSAFGSRRTVTLNVENDGTLLCFKQTDGTTGLSVDSAGVLTIPANWSGVALFDIYKGNEKEADKDCIIYVYPDAPQPETPELNGTDLTISWSGVSGVSGYYLRWADNVSMWNCGYAELGPRAKEYTISSLTPGKPCYVSIYSFSDSQDDFRACSSVVSLAPVMVGAEYNTLLDAENQVLAWNSTASTLALEAYTEDCASIDYAIEDESTSCESKAVLKENVLYLPAGYSGTLWIKATAAPTEDYGLTEKVFCVFVMPKETEVTASLLKQTTISLSWSEVEGALFYDVLFSEHSDMSAAARVSCYKTNYSLKNLKLDTTYYIQVVAQIASEGRPAFLPVYSRVITKDTAGEKTANTIVNFKDLSFTGSDTKKTEFTVSPSTEDEASITLSCSDSRITPYSRISKTYTIPAGYVGSFTLTATAAETIAHKKTEKTITVTVLQKDRNELLNFRNVTLGQSRSEGYVYMDAYTADGAAITYTSADAPVAPTGSGDCFVIPAGYTGSFTVTATAEETEAFRRTGRSITVTVYPREANTILGFEDMELGCTDEDRPLIFSASTEDGAAITYSSPDAPSAPIAPGSYVIPAGYTGSFTVIAAAAETELHLETTKTITVTVCEKTANFIWNMQSMMYGQSHSEQYVYMCAYTADEAPITYTWENAPVEPEYPYDAYTIPVDYVGSFTITATAAETELCRESSKTITITVYAKEDNTILGMEDRVLHRSNSERSISFSASTEDGAYISYTYSGAPAEPAYPYDEYTLPAGYVGSFTVTAYAEDTRDYMGTSKTATVTVLSPEENEILGMEDVVLTQSSKGQTIIFKAYTLDEAPICYTHSGAPVEPTGEGNVYTIPAGYTGSFTVTAAAEETELHYATQKTVTVQVKKKVPVASFKLVKYGKTAKLNGKTLSMSLGSKQRIAAVNFRPKDATDTRVRFTSSNSRIVKVSSAGVLTARRVGVAIITATAKDGSGTKVSFKVKVTK